MISRFIVAFWMLLAAFGALSGDSHVETIPAVDHLVRFATEAALTVRAHNALHTGDFSTNDFAQRGKESAHARPHASLSKRFMLVEADRNFLGLALDIDPGRLPTAAPRPTVAANQARAPPV